MCDIMYSEEFTRSPRTILRFHNVTFQHSVLCREMFPHPASVTKQKMFGNYFHTLSCHTATFYRIVALRSLNSEMQERLFNTCNEVTKATSNRQANNLMQNILIRTQAELQKYTLKTQESEVRTLASTLAPFSNTTFTKVWIEKHKHVWQTHLERIADFLLCGVDVWWQDTGSSVEFLDGPSAEDCKTEGPPLHHFRTSNIAQELSYLSDCWKTCINKKVKLPTDSIRIFDNNGTLLKIVNLLEEQNGDRTGGEADNGDSTGGEEDNGDSTGGEEDNGDSTGGEEDNGDSTGGEADNGDSTGGEADNGDSTGGQADNGDSTGGEEDNGDST